MRVLAVGTIIASLVMSISQLHAQYEGTPQDAIDKMNKAQRDDAEKAYQKALKDRNQATPTTANDPWGGVRNADQQPKK